MKLFIDETQISLINYSLSDGLKDGAIIPIKFHLCDGAVKYKDKASNIVEFDKLSQAPKQQSSAALYCSLHTDLAKELMITGLAHFNEHRQSCPSAKLLIICPDQPNAKYWGEYLKSIKIDLPVAISEQSVHAKESISRFKNHDDCWGIITVGMAYEGLDVPEISHIICLTKIRSAPWLEQAFGRAIRPNLREDPKGQVAHVFMPRDPEAERVIEAIISEQDIWAKTSEDETSAGGRGADFMSSEEIDPLFSSLDDIGIVEFDVDSLLTESASHETENKAADIPLTPNQRMWCLRKDINNLCKELAKLTGVSIEEYNRELKRRFGKSRSDMTIVELTDLLDFLGAEFDELISLPF